MIDLTRVTAGIRIWRSFATRCSRVSVLLKTGEE